MNSLSKIVIGSAQFGMDYGIVNDNGKIPQSEVFEILNLAKVVGIHQVDTASLYGKSEEILGAYNNDNPNAFKFDSKFTISSVDQLKAHLFDSLQKLKIKELNTYYFHNFDDYLNSPDILEDLIELKEEKIINKIGFSIYFPSQLEKLLKDNITFDVVQFPYNLLDRRFEYLFEEIKSRNIKIYVRSVFLQGVLITDPYQLSDHFNQIKKDLIKFHDLCYQNNITSKAVCLQYALDNRFIDKVIIGVDSLSQFRENIEFINRPINLTLFEKIIESLRTNDEQIIIPMNWK